MRTAEGKYNCDLCKLEFDLYPLPQSLVVHHIHNGDNVVPDVCQDCQNIISDFLDSMKK